MTLAESTLTSMMLNKRQRNRIYETIKRGDVDPAEFNLEDTGNNVVITHDSGSKFEFSRRAGPDIYDIIASVVEGDSWTDTTSLLISLEDEVARWVREIRQTVGVPDYWAEMQRGRELIAEIQQDDSGNTLFTQDEQRQIAAQLQDIKNSLAEIPELSNKQRVAIEERLDEAEEASKRIGRKDWLLLFSGIILTLIITDIVTPEVARHILIMVLDGLRDLFMGGGPPQILS